MDSSNVKIVLPVLIVQESYVSSEVTAPCLVDTFGTLKRKQQLDPKVYYTFPLILDVFEVATLKPSLVQNKVSFIDCLMERVRAGGSGSLSFRDFLR